MIIYYSAHNYIINQKKRIDIFQQIYHFFHSTFIMVFKCCQYLKNEHILHCHITTNKIVRSLIYNYLILPAMDEQQQQFELFPVLNSNNKLTSYAEVIKACKSQQQRIVRTHINNTIEKLIDLCHDEYGNGICNQIFPVTFKKNQEDQLHIFLNRLHTQFQNKLHQIFPSQNSERILIIPLGGLQVRQIVLNMYIQIENGAEEHDLIIFIVQDITDLSDENIYCFEKGLKNKKFISILCTFHTFQNQQKKKHDNFEKYHLNLYNPKDLFCQYIYQCLCSPIIKPYLPEEILGLISDMDFYSISYRENCRRFTYCLEKSMVAIKKDRIYVEVEPLIDLIEQLISKRFRIYHGYKTSLEKILKVILSEKEMYTISERSVIMEIAMQASQSKIQEEDLMRAIRESLKKHLKNRPQFEKYACFLDQKQDQFEPIIRKKKTRSDLLGIDTKKNLTPKNKLENQITRIIKQATAGIRSQAAQVNWGEIKFQLRIKPQIPFLVVQALKQIDQDTNMIVEEILSNYSSPLAKYLDMFDTDDYGRVIYILKYLELTGLLDYNKKQIRPIITNNYFEKAKFSGNFK